MDREKLIDKIRKLLALAGNNPNENERLRAMEMAHKLLDDYNIDMKEVQGEEKSPVGLMFLEDMPEKQWVAIIAAAAGELYHCRLLKDQNNKHYYLGTEENVIVAIEIAMWLSTTLFEKGKAFAPSNEMAQDSFCIGASTMIANRVHEIVRSKLATGETTGTSLMLRNKFDKMNEDFLRDQINTVETPIEQEQVLDGFGYLYGQMYGQHVGLEKQIAAATEPEVKKIE